MPRHWRRIITVMIRHIVEMRYAISKRQTEEEAEEEYSRTRTD